MSPLAHLGIDPEVTLCTFFLYKTRSPCVRPRGYFQLSSNRPVLAVTVGG